MPLLSSSAAGSSQPRIHPHRATVLCLLALLVLSACSQAPTPGAAPEAIQADASRVSFPSHSPMLQALSLQAAKPAEAGVLRVPARLGWDETRTWRVQAPLSGQVVVIEVEQGQHVEQGTPLLQLHSADAGQWRAELESSRALLEQAERQQARDQALHADGIVSTRELEASTSAWASARAAHRQAQAQVRLYQAEQGVGSPFVLRAPAAGIVVERAVIPGQWVGPDTETEHGLLTLSDPTRLWVWLDLPEARAAQVRPGQRVRLQIEGQAPVDTQISYVADHVDPQRRSVAARAVVENPQRRLKAGAYLKADIELPTQADSVALPAAGVLVHEGHRIVFVETAPGVFERRAVQASDGGAHRTLVHSGVRAGERVVVRGGLLLQQLVTTAPVLAQDPT